MKKVVCIYDEIPPCDADQITKNLGSHLEVSWVPIHEVPKTGHLYVCPVFLLNELLSLKYSLPIIACGSCEFLELLNTEFITDYMREPWTAAELLYRAQKALGTRVFQFSWGNLYCNGYYSEYEGQSLNLQTNEHLLLYHLALHAGKLIPRKVLLSFIGSFSVSPREIDVYVCHIRKNLNLAKLLYGADVLVNKYGKGYYLQV